MKLRCCLGHDIVQTDRIIREVGWNEIALTVLLGFTIVGLPILYLIVVHSNWANDWYINGICTRCDKVWFDCDEANKKIAERYKIEASKRDRFKKLANFRKKALGE